MESTHWQVNISASTLFRFQRGEMYLQICVLIFEADKEDNQNYETTFSSVTRVKGNSKKALLTEYKSCISSNVH